MGLGVRTSTCAFGGQEWRGENTIQPITVRILGFVHHTVFITQLGPCSIKAALDHM